MSAQEITDFLRSHGTGSAALVCRVPGIPCRIDASGGAVCARAPQQHLMLGDLEGNAF
jgi:hypothetical protein